MKFHQWQDPISYILSGRVVILWMIVYNWFTCSICFVHEYWLHCSSSESGFKRLLAKCKKKRSKDWRTNDSNSSYWTHSNNIFTAEPKEILQINDHNTILPLNQKNFCKKMTKINLYLRAESPCFLDFPLGPGLHGSCCICVS